MTVGITRHELGAGDLRREARRCRDGAASRRMLALALVLEGASREEAAHRAIEEAQIIRLSVEDQRTIAEAIVNPPPLAPALEQAIERHRTLIPTARIADASSRSEPRGA